MKMVPIERVLRQKIAGVWGTEPVSANSAAVIRTANFLDTGRIDYSNIALRQVRPEKIRQKRLEPGDVIIEKSGGSPTQPVGRVVLFCGGDSDRTYLCNNFTTILRPDKSIIDPEYLLYILLDNHRRGKTLPYQNRTTGISNLRLDGYLQTKIPLPLRDDQRRIAHVLGKVQALICRRRERLRQLDELTETVFIKMFGDPARNEKGWKKGIVGDLIADAAYGTDAPAKGGPYKYLRMNNITYEGRWDFSRLKYIDMPARGLEKYGLKKGDVVFNRTNSKELVGKSAVYTDDEPAVTAGYLIRIRAGRHADPRFIWGHLNSRFGKIRLRSLCRNIAGMANINAQELQRIPVLLPPLALQEEFAAVAVKIEQAGSRCRQSLAELENLYGALSRKAFQGELDLSRIPLPAEE